jgi:hypothetical protein
VAVDQSVEFAHGLRATEFVLCVYIYWAGVKPSSLLPRLLIDQLYEPWMIDGVDCGAITGINEWQGKAKVFGGNLPQFRSVHYKSHMT